MIFALTPPPVPEGWYEDMLAGQASLEAIMVFGLSVMVFLLAVLVVGSWKN